MIQIILTPSELMWAAMAGVMRRCEDLKKNSKSVGGIPEDYNWRVDIDGALAEMALAKYLNLYWSGKGKKQDYDVGGCVDCRQTKYNTGELLIKKTDPDDRKIYLLTGLDGKYIVRGWFIAADGRQDKYWKEKGKDRGFGYWVPQEDLNQDEISVEEWEKGSEHILSK